MEVTLRSGSRQRTVRFIVTDRGADVASESVGREEAAGRRIGKSGPARWKEAGWRIGKKQAGALEETG